MTHTEIVSFLWDVANLIRDSFKRGKYQDVILPLAVLRRLDCVLANPPYGKDWKRDKFSAKAEHERGAAGRFGPGLPRISDGQTLCLMHMLARAKPPREGGARVAIIMNGSPLRVTPSPPPPPPTTAAP